MADARLDSLDLHQWYLDPTLVIFTLGDEGLPNEERQALGSALADADRPQKCAPEKPGNAATVSTKRLAPDKPCLSWHRSQLQVVAAVRETGDDVS